MTRPPPAARLDGAPGSLGDVKVRFGIGLGLSNVVGEPAISARLVDRLEEMRFESLRNGITKFVLIPAAPPSTWDDELVWPPPVVNKFGALS